MVMHKRLTLEGEGGSDDKRIMSLVKTFVRYSFWFNKLSVLGSS